MPRSCLLAVLLALSATAVHAGSPSASYIFPAGAQRGTAVPVRVGGLHLYDRCDWELTGPGLTLSKHLERTATRWFEGPMLPLPDSQRSEDYPRDMLGHVRVAADAPLGPRRLRLWTSEGAASGPAFLVGELPEVVEEESQGDPVAVPVTLPVTINGRIFPREDVDEWSFTGRKGQTVVCEVHAARINSPLDSRLEILDRDGNVLADNDDARGTDSLLHFTPPADGTYRVRIDDAHRGGSQRHVYRLTLTTGPYITSIFPLGGKRGTSGKFTLRGAGVPSDAMEVKLTAATLAVPIAGKASNSVTFDLDDLPESRDASQRLETPVIANGCIRRPGDAETWTFAARKNEPLELELRARRLGSPLLGELEILDSADKVLVRSTAGSTDPVLRFTPPSDGAYRVRVRDQFRTRGGAAFAYRLRIAKPNPDYRLEFTTDALTLPREKNVKLTVQLVRLGGFTGPVTLTIEGLPAGVKTGPLTIAANQTRLDITLTADRTTVIGVSRLHIRGKATVAGQEVVRLATLAELPAVDTVVLSVGLVAPFQVLGAYDLRLAARGSVIRKWYRIERNGFTGPLEVRLADKQARHLQGVTGPEFSIPGDAHEVEYPVSLPPWMEIGRTSRSCIMVVGKITDGGKEHVVSASSQEQNDQIIAVVESGRLGLELQRDSVAAKTGTVRVPFRVSRGKGLEGPVRVNLDSLPRGVRASPAEVSATAKEGVLEVTFTREREPIRMPLTLRATLLSREGPVIAEATLEVVEP